MLAFHSLIKVMLPENPIPRLKIRGRNSWNSKIPPKLRNHSHPQPSFDTIWEIIQLSKSKILELLFLPYPLMKNFVFEFTLMLFSLESSHLKYKTCRMLMNVKNPAFQCFPDASQSFFVQSRIKVKKTFAVCLTKIPLILGFSLLKKDPKMRETSSEHLKLY